MKRISRGRICFAITVQRSINERKRKIEGNGENPLVLYIYDK